MTKIITITDDIFEELVEKSKLPVLLDFSADWCGPCKTVTPIFEELAKEYDGKAVIAKLDVDESPNLPNSLGIRSIPTIVLYVDGKLVNTSVGAQDKKDYAKLLDEVLKK